MRLIIWLERNQGISQFFLLLEFFRALIFWGISSALERSCDMGFPQLVQNLAFSFTGFPQFVHFGISGTSEIVSGSDSGRIWGIGFPQLVQNLPFSFTALPQSSHS